MAAAYANAIQGPRFPGTPSSSLFLCKRPALPTRVRFTARSAFEEKSTRRQQVPRKEVIDVSGQRSSDTNPVMLQKKPEVSNDWRGGRPAILAIGTAVPPNVIDQSTYPDYYFRITDSDHLVDLKHKFQRICEKSRIKKRHTCLTEEILRENPSMRMPMSPSLTPRQAIVEAELPKLAQEASLKAIAQWGQPKSAITHLVFCTTSPSSLPGFDLRLAQLLGLGPSVQRLLLCQQGCFGGGTALRVAKGIAEADGSARVLVVCAETAAVIFRGPSESNADGLVGSAIFGDGAAAAIVGAHPEASEKPVFEIISATQAWIPGTESAITGQVVETGLAYSLRREIPSMIAANVEKSVAGALGRIGISDWNSIFWAVHPGGPAILDAVEARLGLVPERLRASRRVLEKFGNMSSASLLFVADELRESSAKTEAGTTGEGPEGLEWGMLLAFGPGITLEMVVLRSVSNN